MGSLCFYLKLSFLFCFLHLFISSFPFPSPLHVTGSSEFLEWKYLKDRTSAGSYQLHAWNELKLMSVVNNNVDFLFFLWPHGPEKVNKHHEEERNEARLVWSPYVFWFLRYLDFSSVYLKESMSWDSESWDSKCLVVTNSRKCLKGEIESVICWIFLFVCLFACLFFYFYCWNYVPFFLSQK